MNMYVILVKSGCEKSVFHQLKKRGFDAFMPTKKEFRNYGGKLKSTEKIIFKNYIFLRCEMSEKIYSEVLKISGILRFLGSENGEFPPFILSHEQRYIEFLCDKKEVTI